MDLKAYILFNKLVITMSSDPLQQVCDLIKGDLSLERVTEIQRTVTEGEICCRIPIK